VSEAGGTPPEPSRRQADSRLERTKLGGTDPAVDRRRQRQDREERFRPPVTSSELVKAPSDLVIDTKPRVNWRVLIIASAIILAFSVWAMVAPAHASTVMQGVVGWIGTNLGWYYVLTITIVIGFVLWVALSKEGKVRLGPDHSRPQYKLFTWVAMLFAAGVGIDMLFYSVTGPIQHYLQPPSGAGGSPEAAQDAVVWTMFHYGIAGWSMYSLLGMAMGYFAYRWGMPLSIRAALYPLLGKRVKGGLGDTIDIITLVGTMFGVATSMGIGVVLLNIGFAWIFGLPEGLALQIALVVVAVVLTVAATSSGVDKGIKWISELNIWSAAAMLLYILVTGQTSFLLNGIVQNIGRFIFTLPERTLQTFAYEADGAAWMAGQTLFFWAFWLAWGPFVGLFLARISRGRTLREFVIAAITAPVLCDFLIVSIFGNSALFQVFSGNMDFAQLAIDHPEQGWYALLEMFPGAAFLIGLATLSGLLFYLTSANSGAMVMANFSSSIPNPMDDGAKWLRIFWAVVTAVLTIAMLIAGGVSTMEYATLIFALPFTVIAYLIMMSFSKVLRMERAEREGQVLRRQSTAAHGGHVPERTWRQRLAGMRSYPSTRQVAQYMERTVQPALADVLREFKNQGYEATLEITPDPESTIHGHKLTVVIPDHRSFQYHAQVVQAPVPQFGGRGSMSRATDVYYRVEVFAQTGSEGYDLYGLTQQQVIDDVLDRYEAHLGFLTYSHEHDYASVLTPATTPTGSVAVVAEDAAEIRDNLGSPEADEGPDKT
jgi:choline/glycine/proline betaine transport protein